MLVGISLVYHGAAIQGFLLNLKYVSPEVRKEANTDVAGLSRVNDVLCGKPPIFISHESVIRFVSFTQFPLLAGYFSYLTEALIRHIIK